MKLAVLGLVATAMGGVAAKDKRSFAVLRFNNKHLTTGRMGPIRYPGQTATHVHHVLGGSGFSVSSTGPDLAGSGCSSAMVKGDNSNYWFPSLYFKDPATAKYELVDVFYANAYYFFEATNDSIKPFPLGLGVISGDTDLRSPPAGGAVTNLDPSKGPVNPVKWTCPRKDNVYSPPSWPAGSDGRLAGIGDPVNKAEGVGFPDTHCDGFASPLRADVHFPSCYNPRAGLLDYKRNMAFPSATADGKLDCPDGYVYVPHLFLEVYWDTAAFQTRWQPGKDKQPFVLSSGDTTGYGLHADFMAGWDEQLLQHIIDTCDASTAGMDRCQGLLYGLNHGNCTIQSSVAEDIRGPLQLLPGPNPLTGWSYGLGNTSHETRIVPEPVGPTHHAHRAPAAGPEPQPSRKPSEAAHYSQEDSRCDAVEMTLRSTVRQTVTVTAALPAPTTTTNSYAPARLKRSHGREFAPSHRVGLVL